MNELKFLTTSNELTDKYVRFDYDLTLVMKPVLGGQQHNCIHVHHYKDETYHINKWKRMSYGIRIMPTDKKHAFHIQFFLRNFTLFHVVPNVIIICIGNYAFILGTIRTYLHR